MWHFVVSCDFQLHHANPTFYLRDSSLKKYIFFLRFVVLFNHLECFGGSCRVLEVSAEDERRSATNIHLKGSTAMSVTWIHLEKPCCLQLWAALQGNYFLSSPSCNISWLNYLSWLASRCALRFARWDKKKIFPTQSCSQYGLWIFSLWGPQSAIYFHHMQ